MWLTKGQETTSTASSGLVMGFGFLDLLGFGCWLVMGFQGLALGRVFCVGFSNFFCVLFLMK